MAHPIPVVPGTTYLITRRTRLRELLLVPDPFVNQVILFCFGWAAERFGVELHAVCAMSNHVHALVTDTRGELPRFLHWVFRHVACLMKQRYGILDRFWDGRGPSRQVVVELETAAELASYIAANPTAAGLVECAEQWPGVVTMPEQHLAQEPLEVTRPNGFFRDGGPVPKGATATLELVPPPCVDRTDGEAVQRYVAAVRARLEARERDAAAKLEAEGRSVLGPKRVRDTPRTRRARGWEPFGVLTPTFLARDRELRAAMALGVRRFREAYREARDAWLTGSRKRVPFPPGTWALRGHPGVVVADPPAAVAAAA